ncbi:poly-beta-1,6 N-acetyl-D-glucosamine export porin PgaA [Bradyrhizobium diazoefficiens]|nr:poly-beta-1,6 N-acetyl-D-glucosamine export porin PgaA [Bradyrhizobium diazoefficiens]MBR0778150.1 poly-beta-1,6 N-acetyl-D-glucosamine export porin PgaA [Bradyrhizobium diazoefficiens]
MKFARRWIIAGWIVIAGTIGTEQALAQTVTERREAAVLQSRAGHLSEAIDTLRAMLAAGEEDGLVAMDLTALLQQAGKSGEAIRAFDKAALAEPPDYALLAAARAYRDLRRYGEAEKLTRQGLKRFPDQTVWPLLLALVLTDAGRPKEAIESLGRPEAQKAPPLERYLAEGYAWRRAGDPYRAISAYTDALKLAPANQEARSAAASLLAGEGGAFGAVALAGTTPPYAPAQAAEMVRWGADTRPADPAHRFDGTDAAIARLDRLLAERPPPSAGTRRRLRLDRLVALRDRVRMREVVEEGNALRARGPLPPYAEEAYADALLYLRRPQEARAAYCRVLAADPKELSAEARLAARYGLFHASVEAEDFDTAYAVIDAVVNDQPIWRTYNDSPARHANTDRANAEVAAASARYFGNQLADAWARITRIADAAPADKSARLTVYQVAHARGWPRRARIEGEIAASLDPDSVGTKIALAEIAIADYRFARAQRMVGDLLAQFPEDLHVQRLARELDANLGWLVETEAKPSKSSGGGANAAGQALTLQTRVTTPPIADNWQLFAVTDYANANPPEGFVQRGRLSAGIAWRSSDFTATLYPSQSWGTLSKAGGGATLDWSMTDQFKLSFAGELFSWDTPLRALLHGITADSIATKATYRWDESRSLSGSFGYMPFTDGNQRFIAGAIYAQRLINIPHFDLTATGEVSASRNNRPEAPYYNPDSDLTVDAGLLAEHVLWRRYDTSLVQAFLVNGGLYAEAHHGTNVIATVSYEHRWRFEPYMDLHYGVQFTRRVYDGSVENTGTITLGGRWRF